MVAHNSKEYSLAEGDEEEEPGEEEEEGEVAALALASSRPTRFNTSPNN